MKTSLLKFALLLTVLLQGCKDKTDSEPVVTWNKSYGGSDYDWLSAMVATPDGGYLLGGTSTSDVSGDKSEFTRNSEDYWVVKVNADGSKAWDKTFGGAATDELYSVINTPDGGFLLGGSSQSVTGNDKTEGSRGGADYWVVKLDATGNKTWDRTFGGDNWDVLTAIAVTPDGGYVLAGGSVSGATGDKSEAARSINNVDGWVIKLNADGSKAWDKSFGGINEDYFYSVAVTADGTIILGGTSNSVTGNTGTDPFTGLFYPDYWVVKLNANGTKVWEKFFGGNQGDDLKSLIITADGGYLLAGNSRSDAGGDKTSENAKGDDDYWVVKLNKDGNKVWDRTFGGINIDRLTSVTASADGGWLLAGTSQSGANGDKSEASKGRSDYWIVKLNASGNKAWDKTYGGDDEDNLASVIATKDGGFLIGGTSFSVASGDKLAASKGMSDFWIIKMGSTPF